jgi:hypothetical protein
MQRTQALVHRQGFLLHVLMPCGRGASSRRMRPPPASLRWGPLALRPFA